MCVMARYAAWNRDNHGIARETARAADVLMLAVICTSCDGLEQSEQQQLGHKLACTENWHSRE